MGQSNPIRRPFLRWAGSKQQLVHVLKSFWPPEAQRYVEPFCGSACLFFHVSPRQAVLGDINQSLVGTYRTIKWNAAKVALQYRELRATKREYYRIRKQPPASLTPTKKAARFVYLNRYCFNGLYRTNRAGDFNVPYGGHRQRKITAATLLCAASALRKATLVSGDFSLTLRKVKAGDFVYLDPPYVLKTRRIFSEYDKDSFSTADLERLKSELHRISALGAWFLLSYADTPQTREVFSDWFLRRVVTRRNIAGFTGNRRKSHEILVANFPLVEP